MPRLKISIATLMMLVVTAASALALFAGINERWHGPPDVINPWPVVMVIAIIANGLILAALRKHASTQAMLQITVVCVLFSAFIRWNEAYWALFLLLHYSPFVLFLVLVLLWIGLPAILIMEVSESQRSMWIKIFEPMLCIVINVLFLSLEVYCVVMILISIFD